MNEEGETSMKSKIDWANVKLTKEQQKLAADNERLIGYVSYKLYHFQRNSEEYELCYGYAATGLCQAAKIYDPSRGTFAAIACRCIKFAINDALRKRDRYRAALQPISLDAPLCLDANDNLDLLAPAPDEIEPLEYKILCESVYQKVETFLTPMQKKAFRPWLHGEEETEIAREINTSYASVKNLIHFSKKRCIVCFNPDEIFS